MVHTETSSDLGLLDAPMTPQTLTARSEEAGDLREVRSPLVTTLLVVGLTGTAFFLRWALSPILKDDSPFSIFVLSALVSSLYRGFRAGVLATVMGALLAWYFFLQPYRSFALQDTGYLVQLCIFLVSGVAASAVNEGWHRARRRVGAHEEFLSTVLENTPTGVLVLDVDGYITFVNSAAANLFGLAGGLLVGRSYREVGLLPATGDNASNRLDNLMNAGSSPQHLRLVIEDAAAVRIDIVARVTRFPQGATGRGSGLVLSLMPA